MDQVWRGTDKKKKPWLAFLLADDLSPVFAWSKKIFVHGKLTVDPVKTRLK